MNEIVWGVVIASAILAWGIYCGCCVIAESIEKLGDKDQ